jgi:hypothetical protein
VDVDPPLEAEAPGREPHVVGHVEHVGGDVRRVARAIDEEGRGPRPPPEARSEPARHALSRRCSQSERAVARPGLTAISPRKAEQ